MEYILAVRCLFCTVRRDHCCCSHLILIPRFDSHTEVEDTHVLFVGQGILPAALPVRTLEKIDHLPYGAHDSGEHSSKSGWRYKFFS